MLSSLFHSSERRQSWGDGTVNCLNRSSKHKAQTEYFHSKLFISFTSHYIRYNDTLLLAQNCDLIHHSLKWRFSYAMTTGWHFNLPKGLDPSHSTKTTGKKLCIDATWCPVQSIILLTLYLTPIHIQQRITPMKTSELKCNHM